MFWSQQVFDGELYIAYAERNGDIIFNLMYNWTQERSLTMDY